MKPSHQQPGHPQGTSAHRRGGGSQGTCGVPESRRPQTAGKSALTMLQPGSRLWNQEGWSLRQECCERCGGTQEDQARRGARKIQEATPIFPTPRGINPRRSSGRSASWPEPGLHLRTQKNSLPKTSQKVQGLRLHASNAGDTGSIPGWGIKIPNVSWHGQIFFNF